MSTKNNCFSTCSFLETMQLINTATECRIGPSKNRASSVANYWTLYHLTTHNQTVYRQLLMQLLEIILTGLSLCQVKDNEHPQDSRVIFLLAL